MLKTLLKKQFKETFTVFTTGRKGTGKKKNNKLGFIILYAICFISLLFAFYGISDVLGSAILPLGIDWLFFTLLAMMALAFSVVGSAFSSYTALYNARDNELLLSLPIPPIYLLICRMVVIFTLSLVFETVVLLPASVYYWIHVGPTVLNIIGPIISIVALNFIATALSCILGWLVALIASRVKNKNAATVIFTLLFLACYYVFYFNAQKLLQKLIMNIDKYNFKVHIIGSAMTGNILSLLALIVIAVVIFGAVCYVLSKSFIKITTRNTAQAKKEYKFNTSAKKSSVKKALRNREIKHFLGSPVYMLNCGLGLLVMPAAGILLLVKAKDIGELLGLIPSNILAVFVFAAVIVAASLCCFTAPSISLEGRNLWVVRSLPVNSMDILTAKLELHEILSIPPAIVMAILICLALKIELTLMVAIIAAAYVLIVVEAQVGLILNLKMPNLSWTNEAVPVKQSLPVLICLLGGMVVGVVFGFGYYLLRNTIDSSVYLYAILLAGAIVSRYLGNWIRTKGVELFEAL